MPAPLPDETADQLRVRELRNLLDAIRVMAAEARAKGASNADLQDCIKENQH